MDRTGSGLPGSGFRTAGGGGLILTSYAFRLRCASGAQPEIFEQHLLLAGQEAQLEPAEDVVGDRLGVAEVGIAAPAAGFEAGVGKLFAEQAQRNAVLQCDRGGQREAVHQAADRRSFFRHGDEQFAGLSVGIEADGDVALVVSDFELVRDRGALFLQAVAHGARRSVHVLFLNVLRGGDAGIVLGGVRSLGAGGRERLRLLAAIAIDGDCLQAQLPGLEIGFHDVFHAGVLGKIDRLRDGAGDEGLRGSHHAKMSHVGDGARALRGLEGAIEDGEMLVLNMRRAFDGAGGVDVADDGVGLLVVVAELEQRRGHSVVDDLDHAPADELLVLDQGEIGLDSGSVAVHHEADGAGGGQDCDLGIAVAVFFAVGEGFVPALFAGFVDAGGDVCFVDAIHARAVHADYVEEGFAVDVPAGAGSAGHDVGPEIGFSEALLRCFGCGD